MMFRNPSMGALLAAGFCLSGLACSGAQVSGVGSQLTPVQPGASASANVAGPAGQHPTLLVPHHIAEGKTGKPSLTRTARSPRDVTPSPVGYLPDPPAQESAEQWRYLLAFDGGQLSVSKVEALSLSEPRRTPRQMGRFALELWIGRELLERVRFDFPLLGAPPPEKSAGTYGKPIDVEQGLHVTQVVFVPNLARATRAQWVDRATGDVVVLPWPPVEAAPASAEAPRRPPEVVVPEQVEAPAPPSTPGRN